MAYCQIKRREPLAEDFIGRALKAFALAVSGEDYSSLVPRYAHLERPQSLIVLP